MANRTLNFEAGNGNWYRPSNHEGKLHITPEDTHYLLKWCSTFSIKDSCWWWDVNLLHYLTTQSGSLEGMSGVLGFDMQSQVPKRMNIEHWTINNGFINVLRDAFKNVLADFARSHWFSVKGRGGYPPIPSRKKSAKNGYFWPKNANFSPFWPIFLEFFLGIFR